MTDINGDDNEDGKQYLVSFSDITLLKKIVAYEPGLLKRVRGDMLELTKNEHKELVARLAILKAKAETAQAVRPPPKRSTPPATAAFLLAFIAPKNSAQAQLGDLEEIFQKNVDRFGEREARRLYWFEVARSFGPLVWQWVKRMGFVTLVVDYVRSKFGL